MFAEDPEPSVETSRSPEWSWWYRWKSVETRTHSEWRGWYR